MNPLANAIAGALSAVAGCAGVPIRYVRGRKEIRLDAILGQTVFGAEGEEGVSTLTKSRDFIFAWDLLTLDTERITPQRHDKIFALINGAEVECHLLEDATGRCYRADQTATQLRVYTKEV